jgi:NADH-quinone oxidoreductase subunit E
MLTGDELKKIKELARQSETPRAASVEALKSIQGQRGWVSDEAVRDIAGELAMAPDEVDALATFYSFIFRRPAGRHVIFVCDGAACWVMGTDNILSMLSEKLGIGQGETTPDNRFTLLPVSCIGFCDHAPAMIIDGEYFGDLDKEKIETALEKFK